MAVYRTTIGMNKRIAALTVRTAHNTLYVILQYLLHCTTSHAVCGYADPCSRRPCADISNAVGDSCQRIGTEDYVCQCTANQLWLDKEKTCVAGL